MMGRGLYIVVQPLGGKKTLKTGACRVRQALPPLDRADFWICCSPRCLLAAIQISDQADHGKASVCIDLYEEVFVARQASLVVRQAPFDGSR